MLPLFARMCTYVFVKPILFLLAQKISSIGTLKYVLIYEGVVSESLKIYILIMTLVMTIIKITIIIFSSSTEFLLLYSELLIRMYMQSRFFKYQFYGKYCFCCIYLKNRSGQINTNIKHLYRLEIPIAFVILAETNKFRLFKLLQGYPKY